MNTQGSKTAATMTLKSNTHLGIILCSSTWSNFLAGRMQATRASWDVKNKKWFHQYAGQKFTAARLVTLDGQCAKLEYHVCQMP